VAESSPAAHLLVRGLCDAAAGFQPATQSPHPPSLALSSELGQSLVERGREAKPYSHTILEAVCARCRRLRCLANGCKTSAVVSAERHQAQAKSFTWMSASV